MAISPIYLFVYLGIGFAVGMIVSLLARNDLDVMERTGVVLGVAMTWGVLVIALFSYSLIYSTIRVGDWALAKVLGLRS